MGLKTAKGHAGDEYVGERGGEENIEEAKGAQFVSEGDTKGW